MYMLFKNKVRNIRKHAGKEMPQRRQEGWAEPPAEGAGTGRDVREDTAERWDTVRSEKGRGCGQDWTKLSWE